MADRRLSILEKKQGAAAAVAARMPDKMRFQKRLGVVGHKSE